MSREDSRRHGWAEAGQAALAHATGSDQDVSVLFEGLLRDALKHAKMTVEDDFSLRLVVTENLPEDRPQRKP